MFLPLSASGVQTPLMKGIVLMQHSSSEQSSPDLHLVAAANAV